MSLRPGLALAALLLVALPAPVLAGPGRADPSFGTGRYLALRSSTPYEARALETPDGGTLLASGRLVSRLDRWGRLVRRWGDRGRAGLTARDLASFGFVQTSRGVFLGAYRRTSLQILGLRPASGRRLGGFGRRGVVTLRGGSALLAGAPGGGLLVFDDALAAGGDGTPWRVRAVDAAGRVGPARGLVLPDGRPIVRVDDVVQAGTGIVVAGRVGRASVDGTGRPTTIQGDAVVVRVDGTGAIDPAFGAGGQVTLPFLYTELAVDPATGEIYAAGATIFPTAFAARLSPAGVLDSGYGNGGLAELWGQGGVLSDIAVDARGRLVAGHEVGSFGTSSTLVAFGRSGASDARYGKDGEAALPERGDGAFLYHLLARRDGRVLVTGATTVVEDYRIDFEESATSLQVWRIEGGPSAARFARTRVAAGASVPVRLACLAGTCGQAVVTLRRGTTIVGSARATLGRGATLRVRLPAALARLSRRRGLSLRVVAEVANAGGLVGVSTAVLRVASR